MVLYIVHKEKGMDNMMSRRQVIRTALGVVAIAASATAPVASATPRSSGDRPAGIVNPEKPFLKLPFAERRAKGLTVTQGWLEERTEESIIGPGVHAAIDFEGYPYGAPILAAADGYAYYCYQRFIVAVDYTDPISGRQINYIDEGAGLFVEIIHDERAKGVADDPRWTTQYIHLSSVAAGIPYVESTKSEATVVGGERIDNWYPSGIIQPQDTLVGIGRRVRQGDVIGLHGDTGIGANWYDNWDPATKVVRPRDRVSTPPWDPQGGYAATPIGMMGQLHFGLYAGRGVDGQQGRQNQIDPFDLYAAIDLGILPGARKTNPYMQGNKVYAGSPQATPALMRRGVNLLFAG